MVTMTVEAFRREVDERRGSCKRGAPRYPDALVMFALGRVQQARAAGRSLHAVASELGLSAMTLSSWLKRVDARPKSLLREVVVNAKSEAAPTMGITLVTPLGYELRGLGVDEAAILLRALR